MVNVYINEAYYIFVEYLIEQMIKISWKFPT